MLRRPRAAPHNSGISTMVTTLISLNVLAIVVVIFSISAAVVDGYSGKVLLVSMDGFRWDYIKSVPGLGNFSRLAQEGCSVDYMNVSFYTKTFPSHYTIVTGLHEESHGIVANAMYDPDHNATFTMSSKETFWWDQGEPVWITAEKKNRGSTAVCFWPGSEAEVQGLRPSIYKAYKEQIPFAERVETVVKWFVEDRKQFVALYFHEPDATGHEYGPSSPQLAASVREMDGVLGLLMTSLEENNLADVNVIVTSDHGMTDVDLDTRLLDVWDYIDRAAVELVPDSGALTAVLPRAGRETEVFANASRIPHATVYRKADIPERFHYKHNSRIMPVIIASEEGWTLTSNVAASKSRTTKGSHGYNNELSSMKPIFFAKGPDFKQGFRSMSVNSVDIYPLMCELLGLKPAPNNGSLDNMMQFLITPTNRADMASSNVSLHFGLLFLSLVLVWTY